MVYVYLFFLITGWTIFTKYKEREEINFYNVLDSFEKHSEGVNPPPLLTEIGLNLKINSLFVHFENLRSFLHLKVVLQKFDFDLLCEAKMFSLKENISSGDFLKF